MPSTQPSASPDAACPTCGSPLAKSPAGNKVLQRVSQAMSQRARQGAQRPPGAPQRPPGMPMRPMGGPPPMPRPGMPPGAPPGAPGGGVPPEALKMMLLKRIMQARQAQQGGMPGAPQGGMRPPGQ